MSISNDVIEMGESGISFRHGGPLEKGFIVPGHAHNFDHVTVISHGAMRIDLLDDAGNIVESTVKRAREARNFILIKKGRLHELTAEEDGTTYLCAYANRDEDGKVVEYYTGWAKAYT